MDGSRAAISEQRRRKGKRGRIVYLGQNDGDECDGDNDDNDDGDRDDDY